MTLRKESYRNGTVALVMDTLDGEEYAVATVNLCHPLQSDSLAVLDENNLPGIGEWIEKNGLGLRMGIMARPVSAAIRFILSFNEKPVPVFGTGFILLCARNFFYNTPSMNGILFIYL